jgi:hypothetical protein
MKLKKKKKKKKKKKDARRVVGPDDPVAVGPDLAVESTFQREAREAGKDAVITTGGVAKRRVGRNGLVRAGSGRKHQCKAEKFHHVHTFWKSGF